MEDLPMSSQVVEGQEPMPGSPQATEIPEGSQPQETSSVQVENRTNNSSQEDTRRSSDFETARQLKRLAKEFQSFKQTLERSSQSASPQVTSPKAQLTQEELVKDPIGAIHRLIDGKLSEFEGKIPQRFQQLNESNRYEAARQDALKLIKTNASVKADPEGQDRIDAIILEEDEEGNSLQEYSKINPKHAAQLALKEYQNRYMSGKNSQSAPSKAQMQTTATAVNGGMPTGNTDQEAAQLYRQIMTNPELMSNPEFLKKLNSFDQKTRLEASLRKK